MSELKLSNISEPASPTSTGQVTVYANDTATPGVPQLYYKDEFGTVTGPIGNGGGGGNEYWESTIAGNIFATGSLVAVTGSLRASFLSASNGLQITGSFTHGTSTVASTSNAYAQGDSTTASGNYSHAEGSGTMASSAGAHAEGVLTIANAQGSHAEGYGATSSGQYSHAEGGVTTASGQYSHAEGNSTSASGIGAHAEGNATTASGQQAHSEGSTTLASGNFSHAEGEGTVASGLASHAEGASGLGGSLIAFGHASHAEGYNTQAGGEYSHSEGEGTYAGFLGYDYVAITVPGDVIFHINSLYSDVTGEFPGFNNTFVVVDTSEYEYYYTYVNSNYDGVNTFVTGAGPTPTATGFITRLGTSAPFGADKNMLKNQHAEGYGTFAYANHSHAEGFITVAANFASHAEGAYTQAIGEYSHAEGGTTTASGNYSHAEGDSTTASGNYSHAEGIFTIASGSGQLTVGKYNQHNNDFSLFVIGDGTNDASRSDIVRVNSGTLPGSGSFEVTGTVHATLGFSGSLTQLTDGKSYLVAGDGITITSESNGPVTISQNEWMTVTLGHDTSTINVGNSSYFGQIYTLAATTSDPTTTANEYVFVSNVTGSIRKVSICSVSSAGAGASKGTLSLKNGTQSTDKTVVSSYEHDGAGKYYNQVHVLTSSLDILPNDVIYFQVVNEYTASYTLKGVYNLLIQVTGTVWP